MLLPQRRAQPLHKLLAELARHQRPLASATAGVVPGGSAAPATAHARAAAGYAATAAAAAEPPRQGAGWAWHLLPPGAVALKGPKCYEAAPPAAGAELLQQLLVISSTAAGRLRLAGQRCEGALL